MNAWSHLPSAAAIDEVLESLKKHPEAWDAARGATWDAVAALIAYDDAGKLIKQPVAHLQGLYRLDPHPMFLLLQPASAVFQPTGV